MTGSGAALDMPVLTNYPQPGDIDDQRLFTEAGKGTPHPGQVDRPPSAEFLYNSSYRFR